MNTEIPTRTPLCCLRGVVQGLLTALGLIFSVAAVGAQDRTDLEASLLSAEKSFAAAAEAKDQEAFASFVAEDAVFAGGNQILRGRSAIVQGWAPFFAPTGPAITWSPEMGTVLDDGSLGITRGPYQVEVSTAEGRSTASKGTFFSVWRRQGDQWKIVLDTGVQCVPDLGTDAETDSAPETETGVGLGPFQGLEWLVGTWQGPGLGGECEEVWSAPAGGTMMGMFRLIKDGEVSFYEIITLTERDGKPHLRLKHFGADLSGWEERTESVDFPFVSRTSDTLVFQGLAYHKDGDHGLDIEVELGSTADASHRELLRLRRVD